MFSLLKSDQLYGHCSHWMFDALLVTGLFSAAIENVCGFSSGWLALCNSDRLTDLYVFVIPGKKELCGSIFMSSSVQSYVIYLRLFGKMMIFINKSLYLSHWETKLTITHFTLPSHSVFSELKWKKFWQLKIISVKILS